jgi:hypothetical protein
MVGHDQRNILIAQGLTAQARERQIGLEQAVRGVPAERHDQLRLDQLDLANQIRFALLDFIRLRSRLLGGRQPARSL